MRKFKRALIIPIILVLFIIATPVNSSAVTLLPTANFNGYWQTTPVDGVGGLSFFSTMITKIDYLDETITYVNGPGETMIGAEVILSGAVRTGAYSFSNAVLEIRNAASPSNPYFTATLGDIDFIEDAGVYYLLNPNLDGNNRDTLNLSNISLLDTNIFASRYIDELNGALNGQGISGMKMSLLSFGGDFAGASSGYIVEGLIDGIQPIPEPATLFLLGLGLIGFAGCRKRNKM